MSGSARYSFGLRYAPDGNITSANDSQNGNWAYTYDPFNRLKTAAQSGQALNWDYDRYGNRWHQNVTLGSAGTSSLSFNAGNNRVDGETYDAAGNATNVGTRAYTYDAENRLITVAGDTTASYIYDPEDRRVKTQAYEYLYDQGGHAIAVLNAATGANTYDEVYAGGRHLATYSNSTTSFNHTDWLGTERVRTGPTGAVAETCINLPFGDGQPCTGTDSSFRHFTGDDRDTETGLDHTLFRQYQSLEARWLSVDPLGGNFSDPQSLNRYAYVLNDPTNLNDPLGLEDELTTFYALALAPYSTGANAPAGAGAVVGAGGEALGRPHIAMFNVSVGTKSGTGPSEKKSIVKCFVKGAVVGAVGAVAVGLLAVGAVAIGAPVAAVTGVLGVVAVAGGVALGWDVRNQFKAGNWAGVAYDAGSVVGSSAVGATGGRALAESINGVKSPPWSPGSDWAQGYRFNFPNGSVGKWWNGGTNPESAGGSAAGAGAGARLWRNEGANVMTLWHLLVGICFGMPIPFALQSAGEAKVGFGGYALAITIGLAVGVSCAWTMWISGKTAGNRISKLDSESLKHWCFRALYASSIFWIFLSAVLGEWASSALLRLVV